MRLNKKQIVSRVDLRSYNKGKTSREKIVLIVIVDESSKLFFLKLILW